MHPEKFQRSYYIQRLAFVTAALIQRNVICDMQFPIDTLTGYRQFTIYFQETPMPLDWAQNLQVTNTDRFQIALHQPNECYVAL